MIYQSYFLFVSVEKKERVEFWKQNPGKHDHHRQTNLSDKPCLETRHRIIGARQKAIIINRKSQSRENLGGAFIGRIYATSPIFSPRVRCQI